ncbi:MAG: MBL fold metallo-hydrolase [Gammaproteobacteria bacterium]|nr:MBL fold metallo-hydrolase [Gammaproteobacteria bacterium]
MEVLHHGAVSGVTGSCHELVVDEGHSVLVDCGLFQGGEAADTQKHLAIDFPIDRVRALLVTHCHLDHVGRIPHLIASGFDGPIYCSEATAILLPLVLEDALKIGVTRNRRLVEQFLKLIDKRLTPLPYNRWQPVELPGCGLSLDIRLQRAGHILGSAYIECRIKGGGKALKVIFSGDLGAPYTPLLPTPKSPWAADLLVLESTYGNRQHEGRKTRRAKLKQIVERAFENRGVILIPAFSIGRTQELLYELEEIIHRHGETRVASDMQWQDMEIVLDSPLAARFTDAYKRLRPYWDQEARRKLRAGRHPLSFEQLTTIDDHKTHQQVVKYLGKTGRPTLVIAGSGMCTGGRIVNYLKAMLGNEQTDVLFVGYQAAGTPGRDIQRYGPGQGYVILDRQRVDIRAGVHTLSGYSAHADQVDLIRFVRRMQHQPKEVRLVHGDMDAKLALQKELKQECPEIQVNIAGPA